MRDAGHASCRSEALRSGLETTLSAGLERPPKEAVCAYAGARCAPFPFDRIAGGSPAHQNPPLRPRDLLALSAVLQPRT
jgi:hypothetical protein